MDFLALLKLSHVITGIAKQSLPLMNRLGWSPDESPAIVVYILNLFFGAKGRYSIAAESPVLRFAKSRGYSEKALFHTCVPKYRHPSMLA